MRALLLLLLLFPFIELAVLIQVGSAIGVLPVFLLLIASGMLGVAVMRIAGFTTAWRARFRLAQAQLPDKEIYSGLLLSAAGGLLIFPGLVSDALALLLLLPPVRALIIRRVGAGIAAQMARQRAFNAGGASPFDAPQGSPQRPNVLEGEYERRD